MENKNEQLMQQISKLFLNEPYLNTNTLEFLKKLQQLCNSDPELIYLDLSHKGIRDDAIKLLAKVLERNHVLNDLNLKWNYIGNEGVKALTRILNKNQSLTALNLGDNEITGEGINTISNFLQKNDSLKELRLAHINCGDIGTDAAISIARSLGINRSLTTLDLSSNEITTEAAKYFANLLKNNSVLTTLILANNIFYDFGIKILADGLKKNRSLTKLDLSSNGIHNNGYKALAKALEINKSLVELDLTNNFHNHSLFYSHSTDESGFIALIKMLEINQKLNILKIEHYNFSKDGLETLISALKINQSLTEVWEPKSYFSGEVHEKLYQQIDELLARNKTIVENNINLKAPAVANGKSLSFLQRTLPWWFSTPAETNATSNLSTNNTNNVILAESTSSTANFAHSLPNTINILHTEQIIPITQHNDDFTWDQAAGRVGGSALSSGIFTRKSDGSKWLGKADPREQTAEIEGDACCEKIASDVYAYYSATVPEMCLANHHFVNTGVPEYDQQQGMHIMVKWLDNFIPYSSLGISAHQPLSSKGKIKVNDQWLPERGLGTILAVATFINDIDVIGNGGGNIGFTVKNNNNNDYVQTIKIDPGKAFSTEFKPSSDQPHIRVAPSAEPNYIVFHALPKHTQKEFILTLHDIINTDEGRLASFFSRQGAQQFLLNDRRTVRGLTDTLIQRQQQLKSIYAKELTKSADLYQQFLQQRPEMQAKHQVQRKINELSFEKIAWQNLNLQNSPIAKGGYGTIYQARWQGEDVAVKQFHAYDLTLKNLQDFENEARIMGGLRHVHILPLYGICIEAGHYSLVMQYCPKGSLFDHLHGEVVLSWAQRYQWGTEIGIGISYLHDKNILHRDIKSPNVLIGDDNKAKLIDFGLAKVKQVVSVQHSNNRTAGTVFWKAPELFTMNGKSSFASDCYSYGMVLWELSSPGLVPFTHVEDKDLVSTLVKDGMRENIPKDTPPSMVNLITSLWKQEPKERPTAKESYLQLQANRDEVTKLKY